MDIAVLFDWSIALLTLTALEIVLGIDNIVLLSILTDKLPKDEQPRARRWGLVLALIFRVLLLTMVAWMAKITNPLVVVFSHSFSLRDLILTFGGLFLLAKATTEIFNFVEDKHESGVQGSKVTLKSVLVQIIIFDLIFSLDSVLTAVGLTDQIGIMISAVMIAIAIMIIFAEKINEFVTQNPGIKMLALAFLILIGTLLIAEGFGSHFERGYVYFAMSFSLAIELLNRRRHEKVGPKQ